VLSDTVTIELDTLITIPGQFPLDGVGFKVAKALSAKEALDQIRKTPGSQTGDLKSHASLMQAASVGSSLEFLASDQAAFLAKLDSFQSLMGDALDEVKGLLDSFNGGVETSNVRSLKGRDQGVVNHVLRAFELLEETH
jgi:hypothetical protein